MVIRWLKSFWQGLRRVSGDDAYERYLAHWQVHHPSEGAPLSRAAFQQAEVDRKWSGVKRCC
ncbi:YbdD/YjiX family protein [Methylococcus sp. EFPC2]|nr:YbdD/YjiX family protein [Methylococcus sp. EFPC2]QSA95979.1 YbdD/YjiX family protein [Methylococcus sp. EFPC2]